MGTVSVRDALYHDASPFEAQDTAEDVKYMWDSWTQDTGKHFSLDRGARIAAELLHSWLLRSVTASRPFAHPALRRARSLYGKAPSAGTCFSFDDTFGGAIAEPQVVSMAGWQKKLHEVSQHGEIKLVRVRVTLTPTLTLTPALTPTPTLTLTLIRSASTESRS